MGNRTHQPIRLAAAAAALLLFVQGASAATMYRWVDENGVVNYTQQKPRDVDSEAYTTQGGAPRKVQRAASDSSASSTTGEPPEELDPLTEAQQRVLDELQGQEQKRIDDIARVKQENCEQSRSVLARLTVKDRIRINEESGSQRILGEDERQSRIAEAQQGIARYCEADAA